MAARKCPQCLTVAPKGYVAAFSDAMECPGCKSTLEVSPFSRHIATWAGLLAGVVGWRLASPWVAGGGAALDWLIPVMLAFAAYSVVAAVATMLVADLRVRPPEPVAEPVYAASAAHGAHAEPAGAHAHR